MISRMRFQVVCPFSPSLSLHLYRRLKEHSNSTQPALSHGDILILDTWDSPVILEVTSSSSKRAIRRDLPTKRQSNNTNNDEMLYSPSNSTLPLGSSFNFTYRVDEDDDPSDRTESVAVSLVRYWTVSRSFSASDRRISSKGQRLDRVMGRCLRGVSISPKTWLRAITVCRTHSFLC